MRIIASLASLLGLTVATVQTSFPPLKQSPESPGYAVTYTETGGINVALTDLNDDATFTLIWNSEVNANVLNGKFDQVVFYGTKSGTGGAIARFEDQYNNILNPTNGITLVQSWGTANSKSTVTVKRLLNPDDTTHRGLECGRTYDFATIYEQPAVGTTPAILQRHNFIWRLSKSTSTTTDGQTCNVDWFSSVYDPSEPRFLEASDFAAKYSTTGFECSMDGYVEMINELVQVLIIFISVFKEIIVSIAGENLGKALKYFYNGLTGVSGWIGYLMAAVYYLGLEYNFGGNLCEISGYVYLVIDALYQITNFGTKTENDSYNTDNNNTDTQ